MNSARITKTCIVFAAICFSLLAPTFLRDEYYIHILIMVFLNVLIASGLRVIMTTGLVSFCHAAFVAIGGYTSALCVTRLGMNSWLGLLLAMIIATIIAVAFGLILLRLKGAYFFIATTAFGEIVLLTFTRFPEPFGGAAGSMNIPPPSPIHLGGIMTVTFGSKMSFYYYALALTLLLLLISYRLDRGRMGAIWTGIQEAEPLAQSLGINVMLYKTVAFCIGCSMAAAAGAFQAHYYSHISPGGFGFFALVNYLVFVVIGGSGRFSGPILGAALLTIFSEFLSFYEQYAMYQTIVYGFVLILVVMFLPQGVVSLPGRISSWWYRHVGLQVESNPPG
jgi:branched-chain amino acid transport system permease protein